MVLDVVVTKTNDGFSAEIPSISGCESWAHDEDTVLSKILEMASFYLKTDIKKLKLDKARKVKNRAVYKLVFYKSA